MAGIVFPDSFLWGAATAGHQVEGGDDQSDWWDWERAPGSPCVDPSDLACDHLNGYPDDIALVAALGLNTYRYSVEWARIEPAEGAVDQAALDHYVAVTDAVLAAALTPMVTLNHFTLPRWIARRGGWLDWATPEAFGRYCERVVGALGARVRWYCTINEPGVVAFGGYLGALNFPPGRTGIADWERAIAGLVAGHRRARSGVKALAPDALVGATHQLMEWETDPGGQPFMEWLRRHTEDVFLEASAGDDFIGVQTYTRVPVHVPAALAPLLRLALRWRPLADRTVGPMVRRAATETNPALPPGTRRTQMGYEFRPEAVGATVRRVAGLLPGKPIVVTETGIATADDAERVEFIDRGLAALAGCLADGIPLRGYVH